MSGVDNILSAREACLGVLEKLEGMHGKLDENTLNEIESRLKKDAFNLGEWKKKAFARVPLGTTLSEGIVNSAKELEKTIEDEDVKLNKALAALEKMENAMTEFEKEMDKRSRLAT
ncbi:MAG: hypothetical protein ACUVXA_18370 [Candidatus Jordarchaeum sp.]|uniref:hypothetical protein n=1 Tax=Candidatus Jordarchaeum sp. TaxID=2823881 RepID=UPI00404B36A0